ncbi:hypothetical protein [Rhizobium rhizogenes]|nr:hypothetical protein [Rhizobium rhizogenes]
MASFAGLSSVKFTMPLKEFAVDRSHISAYWPESRRGNPNVKAFVGFLAEIFPNPTPWDMRFQQA